MAGPIAIFRYTVLRGQPLLPPRRARLVPWTGFEILLIVLLNFILVPELVLSLLDRVDLFHWLYGSTGVPDSDTLLRERQGLWVMAIACPLEIAIILSVLRTLSGTRPYQLGLTLARPGSSLMVGWIGWLVLTPLALIVQGLVVHVLTVWLKQPADTHAIMRLVESIPRPVEWVLILFTAVMAAPVMEELFFRGVLQPWFASRPWGGQAAMAASFLLAFLPWLSRSLTWLGASANTTGDRPSKIGAAAAHVSAFRDLEPGIFILILVPLYVLTPRLTRRWVPSAADARAIFGTAALFALFHASVWPSPIALFFLALGLGYLAYRTRSLVPSMACHSLFNAINFVQLLLVWRQE
jgi:membrane protease YdiL (CAAX protease family)